MTRYLKSLTHLGMTVFLISCSSYARNSIKPYQCPTDNIECMLHYASLAGSSHNSQPWQVEAFGHDSILIYADLTRRLAVVDCTNRELYMSIGAFIENLDIAAKCLGYQTNIHINSSGGDNNSPIASVKLLKNEKFIEKSELKEIELRNTLRIPFQTKEIRPSDLERLVSVDSPNIHFVSASSELGRVIAQDELEAYSKQAYNKLAQDELANWIRFSNKDVKQKQDGLSTAGMGIQGLGGFVVRNFFNPEDSKKKPFVTKGIEKTKLLVENCGGWILITQQSDDLASCIYAGRLYEQLNLRCRRLGLGFHPMSQIIEEQGLNQCILPELSGKLMFIARIGYVDKYPVPVSLRRSVKSFTIFR